LADSGDRAARLEALTGALVHRFNNVLMGIQPHVEVIKRTGKDNERILGSATQIETALRRARAVMSEIMRLVRPTVINAQPIAVGQWFEMLRDNLQPFATSLITITFNPGDALVVSGDRDQLSRVIASLVANAVEALPNGGKVSVSARAAGSGVELEVADSGRGMDSETLAHVFDPLFTTKRNSAGLGLSIAQQIVEAHGSMVSIESAPGTSTKVTFVLSGALRSTIA
jgi:signal transduction histidine kinase